MLVRYIELLLDNERAYNELVDQLENQCIQTVELGPGYPTSQVQGKRVLSVQARFGYALDPELLELLV